MKWNDDFTNCQHYYRQSRLAQHFLGFADLEEEKKKKFVKDHPHFLGFVDLEKEKKKKFVKDHPNLLSFADLEKEKKTKLVKDHPNLRSKGGRHDFQKLVKVTRS